MQAELTYCVDAMLNLASVKPLGRIGFTLGHLLQEALVDGLDADAKKKLDIIAAAGSADVSFRMASIPR